MKFTFIYSLFSAFVISFFSFNSMAATEMHGVMCGGEIRQADKDVVNQFMTDNPDVYNSLKISPRGEWNRDTQITDLSWCY